MAKAEREYKLPLEGLMVLDLTRLLPGPLCTMLLGDYGAEIIKIEDTKAGDPTRFAGLSSQGESSLFRQLNRNKKSVALDLKDAAGRSVLKKLAGQADVLVEGFRPGVMDRLGLGYGDLSTINAWLIYAAITGYGQEGSYRDRVGHDLNYTALTGLLDLSASTGEAPQMPAVQIADIAGGSMMALNGIMIALYGRVQSGKGTFVDVSMLRGLLPFLAYPASGLSDEGKLPRRGEGYITGALACYNIYETADGQYMSLGALEPVFWERFCEVVGKPQWVARQFEEKGREELIAEVQALFKEKSRRQWEDLFAAREVCCEPVIDLQEAATNPLNQENDLWIDEPGIEDNHGGDAGKTIGFPLLFSGQSGQVRLRSPRHGEHTTEVLKSLGYGSSEINSMKKRGIIKTAD